MSILLRPAKKLLGELLRAIQILIHSFLIGIMTAALRAVIGACIYLYYKMKPKWNSITRGYALDMAEMTCHYLPSKLQVAPAESPPMIFQYLSIQTFALSAPVWQELQWQSLVSILDISVCRVGLGKGLGDWKWSKHACLPSAYTKGPSCTRLVRIGFSHFWPGSIAPSPPVWWHMDFKQFREIRASSAR